jgi:D-glycero-D-manno-heptose 1,7-bisphosphate phosphatase
VLDRDGTIIVERQYLADPDQVELLPNAAQGLRLLSRMGFRLVLVTNQSGIGRGFFDRACLDRIHSRLAALLADSDVALDGVFYCPHVPEDHCGCRKPETGLVRAAADQLAFEPADAVVIGDKPCDIELGHRVHARTILVRTGYGDRYPANAPVRPDCIAEDLADAARQVAETHDVS